MVLTIAIEAVYEAFSDIEKPLAVEGCPCCLTPEQYETLTAKSLRELSASELDPYALDVLLTVGSEHNFQYFLPRILELTVEATVEWATSAEIVANKMQMAGFEKWDEKKRVAIAELWVTVIREFAKASDPELLGFTATDIDTWLGAATLIPLPIAPLTDALENQPDIIRTIYNDNFKTLFQGRLDNSFLEEPNEGQAEIAKWLRGRVEATMK